MASGAFSDARGRKEPNGRRIVRSRAGTLERNCRETRVKTRSLGTTGMNVSAVGFGAMPLSIAGRPRENDAIRVIHAALDADITLIDTADVYSLDHRDIGHNEQ